MIDKLVIVDEIQKLNNVLSRITTKYRSIKDKPNYEKKKTGKISAKQGLSLSVSTKEC